MIFYHNHESFFFFFFLHLLCITKHARALNEHFYARLYHMLSIRDKKNLVLLLHIGSMHILQNLIKLSKRRIEFAKFRGFSHFISCIHIRIAKRTFGNCMLISTDRRSRFASRVRDVLIFKLHQRYNWKLLARSTSSCSLSPKADREIAASLFVS